MRTREVDYQVRKHSETAGQTQANIPLHWREQRAQPCNKGAQRCFINLLKKDIFSRSWWWFAPMIHTGPFHAEQSCRSAPSPNHMNKMNETLLLEAGAPEIASPTSAITSTPLVSPPHLSRSFSSSSVFPLLSGMVSLYLLLVLTQDTYCWEWICRKRYQSGKVPLVFSYCKGAIWLLLLLLQSKARKINVRESSASTAPTGAET